MRGSEEIEATVFNIRYRSDDGWCVLECYPVPKGGEQPDIFEQECDIVTASDESHEIQKGQSFRFWGRWTNHVRFGRQFKAETFIGIVPFTRNGIIRYLQRCVGIGPSTSQKLWTAYGPDAVRVLREDPERVVKAGYLPRAKAMAAAEKLAEDRQAEGVLIDLMDLLHGRGFQRSVYKLAADTWGNRATEIIRDNPYVLCDLPGAGFKRPDQLYLDLGHPPDALERQTRCLAYMMEKDRQGHTWFRAETTSALLKDMIGATKVRPVECVMKGLESGTICKFRDEQNRLWIAPTDYAADEVTIANVACDLLQHEADWPEIAPETGASDHQIEQWNRCRAGRIAILQGKPGTGKTWLSSQIVKAIVETHGEGSIAVAAPTGRAAVRLTEAMRANGIDLMARTVHRLLGVRRGGGNGSWDFAHGPGDSLPFRYVLVDEFSMQSTEMTARLFEALSPDTHLLIVGDPAQLPPVGHGAPLRDLLAAGVPQACLEEIVRQENPGTIIEAAAAIRAGRTPRTDAYLDPASGRNYKHIETEDSKATADRIVALVQMLPGIDPVWETQVIVATNDGSPCSRKVLNERLQQVLNPNGKRVSGCKFWVGDKIICLENTLVRIDQPRKVMCESLEFLGLAWPCDQGELLGAYRQLARVYHPDAGGSDKNFVRLQRHFEIASELIESGYDPGRQTIEVPVCNGEIGQVIDITETHVVMRFSDPERVFRVPRKSASKDDTAGDEDSGDDSEGGSLKKFDLGYTATCHKFQGSEVPLVLIAIDGAPGARMATCREWIYTALTRARVAAITVGQKQEITRMIDRVKLGQRKTFLRELIEQAPRRAELYAAAASIAPASLSNTATANASPANASPASTGALYDSAGNSAGKSVSIRISEALEALAQPEQANGEYDGPNFHARLHGQASGSALHDSD